MDRPAKRDRLPLRLRDGLVERDQHALVLARLRRKEIGDELLIDIFRPGTTERIFDFATAGFVRADAVLFVVAITDEDEQPVPDQSAQEIMDKLVAAKGKSLSGGGKFSRSAYLLNPTKLLQDLEHAGSGATTAPRVPAVADPVFRGDQFPHVAAMVALPTRAPAGNWALHWFKTDPTIQNSTVGWIPPYRYAQTNYWR